MAIIRRECDKQMAEKKGFLKYCKHEHCKNCVCCIEVDDEGMRSHVQTSVKRSSLYVPKKYSGRSML